ncbi:MAG: nucleotidyltransferase domain-containing protein [Isosphaerales bacterium]
MDTLDDATLAKMVQAIVEKTDPDRVYLFGSRARGDARIDSDVDLLIVERGPFGAGRPRVERINRVYDALAPFRVPTDVLVYSAEEVARWQGSLNHVIGRCCREGKLLYERR